MAETLESLGPQSSKDLEKKIREYLQECGATGKNVISQMFEKEAIMKEYSEKLAAAKRAIKTKRLMKSKGSMCRLFTKQYMPRIEKSYFLAQKITGQTSVANTSRNLFVQSPVKSISVRSRECLSITFEEERGSQWSQQSPCFGRRDDSVERDEVPLLPGLGKPEVDQHIAQRAFHPLSTNNSLPAANQGQPFKTSKLNTRESRFLK